MANESNKNMMEEKMNEEIERIFNGQSTITKEQLKQVLEEYRTGSGRGGRGGGRGRGRGGQNGPMHNEMKQKMGQLLETELAKIGSNTISKEQAKSILLSAGTQAKDEWHAQMDQSMQSAIKDELTKLNVHEVTSAQARDLLRNVNRQIRPSPVCAPSMCDDNMKNDFMQEFKTKHGSNKISADEVWEMMKNFNKKYQDKMGPHQCDSGCEKDKEKKWEEIFNEQYKALFGDINTTKIGQQQLQELAKKVHETMREKCRRECSEYQGKRVCQR